MTTWFWSSQWPRKCRVSSFNAKDFRPASRFGIEVVTGNSCWRNCNDCVESDPAQLIQRHLRRWPTDSVPVDQFVTSAVAEKISALTAETFLRARAERADPAAVRAILDKVPDRAPLAGDE